MLRVKEGADEARKPADSSTRRHGLELVPSAASEAKPRLATQEQRRGVGFLTVLIGVGLDALMVALWPAIKMDWLNGVTVVHEAGDDITVDYRRALLGYTIVAVALLLPLHRRGRLVPRSSELAVTVAARLGLAPIIAALLTGWIRTLDLLMWLELVAVTVSLVLLGRVLTFKLVHTVRTRGYDLEDVIIVGAGSVGRDLALAIEQNPDCGLLPVGFVDRFEERLSYPLIGRPEDLHAILEETQAGHVILGFGAATESELVSYVRDCAHLPVQFYTVPRFFELGVSVGQTGFEVDGFAVTRLGRAGRHHLMWPLKRAVDVVTSSVALLLASPIFAACAIAVKVTSPGPVFFRQVRVSVDHVPFDILKFRTMKYVADPEKQAQLDQKAQAVNLDDDRITPIGRFLRKSHLDELPQLINVLKGEMSIVGPRPERPYFVDQHSEEIEGYAHRHRVPAGITGWAQVNGYWGDSSLEDRVRLDNRYIESWSPWRDFVIGLRTIPTLLGKRR